MTSPVTSPAKIFAKTEDKYSWAFLYNMEEIARDAIASNIINIHIQKWGKLRIKLDLHCIFLREFLIL